jgi:hypothetical protein
MYLFYLKKTLAVMPVFCTVALAYYSFFSFLKEALLGFYQSLFKMCVGVCVFNKKTCL